MTVVALTNLVKLDEYRHSSPVGITIFKYFSKFYPKNAIAFYPQIGIVHPQTVM